MSGQLKLYHAGIFAICELATRDISDARGDPEIDGKSHRYYIHARAHAH